jgi:hypothetical protein
MFLRSRAEIKDYRREAMLGKMKSFFAIMTFVSIFVAVALSFKISLRETNNINSNTGSWDEILEFSTALISVTAFFISAIGSAATVMIGWKAERRQAEETKLKIAQLELQVSELRAKAGSGTV